MEQWLYDRLNENLIVVLLAGFSGFEIVRRLLQVAWTAIQNFPLEATLETAALVARRSAEFLISIFATQAAVGRFAKEPASTWPEAYLTGDMPMDLELDRADSLAEHLKTERGFETPSSAAPFTAPQLRLCGGDCSR